MLFHITVDAALDFDSADFHLGSAPWLIHVSPAPSGFANTNSYLMSLLKKIKNCIRSTALVCPWKQTPERHTRVLKAAVPRWSLHYPWASYTILKAWCQGARPHSPKPVRAMQEKNFQLNHICKGFLRTSQPHGDEAKPSRFKTPLFQNVSLFHTCTIIITLDE